MLVQQILRLGMAFVDVGANWGYFTLMASDRVGPTGRVISLEPCPPMFRMLTQNVAQNSLSNVSALAIGAASGAGTETMVGWDPGSDNWGVSSFSGLTAQAGPQFTIRTQSLDDLLDEQGVREVDLLKMDIEGAEGVALEGMKNGLAQHRFKRLLLELHPHQLRRAVRDAMDILKMIRQCGYIIFKVDHSAQATRHTAYKTFRPAAEILSPFGAADSLDSWPHLLCLSPGIPQ
jgi:FkbM family methyltransferase